MYRQTDLIRRVLIQQRRVAGEKFLFKVDGHRFFKESSRGSGTGEILIPSSPPNSVCVALDTSKAIAIRSVDLSGNHGDGLCI